MNKTWLITGCSEGGIGAGIARAVLRRGYNAVVTARSVSKVESIVKDYPDTALAVALDVRQQRGVEFKRRDEKRIGPVFRVADGLSAENLPARGVLRKQIDILLRKRNLQRFDVGIACDFFQKKHGRTDGEGVVIFQDAWRS